MWSSSIPRVSSRSRLETTNQATQLLIVAASYNVDEFKLRRPDLEAKARRIIGQFTPTDVLKNVAGHEVLPGARSPWVDQYRQRWTDLVLPPSE